MFVSNKAWFFWLSFKQVKCGIRIATYAYGGFRFLQRLRGYYSFRYIQDKGQSVSPPSLCLSAFHQPRFIRLSKAWPSWSYFFLYSHVILRGHLRTTKSGIPHLLVLNIILWLGFISLNHVPFKRGFSAKLWLSGKAIIRGHRPWTTRVSIDISLENEKEIIAWISSHVGNNFILEKKIQLDLLHELGFICLIMQGSSYGRLTYLGYNIFSSNFISVLWRS